MIVSAGMFVLECSSWTGTKSNMARTDHGGKVYDLVFAHDRYDSFDNLERSRGRDESRWRLKRGQRGHIPVHSHRSGVPRTLRLLVGLEFKALGRSHGPLIRLSSQTQDPRTDQVRMGVCWHDLRVCGLSSPLYRPWQPCRLAPVFSS